ncbi:MAG: hypothetical protein HKN72_02615 [Gemmatimonadetes bacterium]|nr:hypothetical protein [Gemmatimonadota bacterium]
MSSSTRPLPDEARPQLIDRISRAIRLRYYQHVYARKILATPPVAPHPDSNFEVHVLTRDEEVLETLWSLKSWYHFSGTRPRLVVYEGGTLSTESIGVLERHFPSCRIVRRERFDRDMSRFLSDHPAALQHARLGSFYCALKLFGPLYYTEAHSVLYFDSDVLFFRKPHEMLELVERGSAFFNSDYQDAYAHSPEFIRTRLGMDIEPQVNAGLFHVSKEHHGNAMDLAEDYFSRIPPADPSHWTINRHEQTVNAILLTGANAVRLSGAHQISRTPLTDRTVSHHFVDDGSRPEYFATGLRRLRRDGFLRRLRGASPPPPSRTPTR